MPKDCVVAIETRGQFTRWCALRPTGIGGWATTTVNARPATTRCAGARPAGRVWTNHRTLPHGVPSSLRRKQPLQILAVRGVIGDKIVRGGRLDLNPAAVVNVVQRLADGLEVDAPLA